MCGVYETGLFRDSTLTGDMLPGTSPEDKVSASFTWRARCKARFFFSRRERFLDVFASSCAACMARFLLNSSCAAARSASYFIALIRSDSFLRVILYTWNSPLPTPELLPWTWGTMSGGGRTLNTGGGGEGSRIALVGLSKSCSISCACFSAGVRLRRRFMCLFSAGHSSSRSMAGSYGPPRSFFPPLDPDPRVPFSIDHNGTYACEHLTC